MKQWQETTQVVRRLSQLSASNRRAALATVVRIEGSSYRRPGAKLLIEESGPMVGGVSGGCLEADVREIGLASLEDGRPRLRHYDTSLDEDAPWGLGLGCNGAIDVFVQPLSSAATLSALTRVAELVTGNERFAICTLLGEGPAVGSVLIVTSASATVGSSGDTGLDVAITRAARARLTSARSDVELIEGAEVFIEALVPPPSLLVIGAGDDARPLAALAATIGFRVSMVDHRPRYLTADRFPESQLFTRRYRDGLAELPVGPETSAVIMTHSLEHDRGWMAELLRTPVEYIGLLGPRARTEEILAGVPQRDQARVFGPVGLDIGADGPEQVALSVVAELLAVRHRRLPRHLRERREVIHVR